MSKIGQFVSIVVYVHNNADRIEKFITVVMKECEIFKQCEIIFVDDCSTDNSVEVIKEFYKNNPYTYMVSIVRLGRYHGIEIAMDAGRDMAVGDYVYEFDDLYVDYDGSVVLDAFNKCLEGNDIVTVSTDVPIRFTSKLFYKVFNKAYKAGSLIGPESFRLLSRRGINRIISMDVEIPYRKAVYHSSGLSTVNIRYKSTTGERPARITEQAERVGLAVDSFIYFTNVIQRISVIVTGLFVLLSIAMAVYVMVSRSYGYHVGMGWVSTMLFLALGFAGLFGLLAIIIRYLSVIVDLVFRRQKYLIADVEKISSK